MITLRRCYSERRLKGVKSECNLRLFHYFDSMKNTNYELLELSKIHSLNKIDNIYYYLFSFITKSEIMIIIYVYNTFQAWKLS